MKWDITQGEAHEFPSMKGKGLMTREWSEAGILEGGVAKLVHRIVSDVMQGKISSARGIVL